MKILNNILYAIGTILNKNIEYKIKCKKKFLSKKHTTEINVIYNKRYKVYLGFNKKSRNSLYIEKI